MREETSWGQWTTVVGGQISVSKSTPHPTPRPQSHPDGRNDPTVQCLSHTCTAVQSQKTLEGKVDLRKETSHLSLQNLSVQRNEQESLQMLQGWAGRRRAASTVRPPRASPLPGLEPAWPSLDSGLLPRRGCWLPHFARPWPGRQEVRVKVLSC